MLPGRRSAIGLARPIQQRGPVTELIRDGSRDLIHTADHSPEPSAPSTSGLDGREFVSVLVTENGKSKALVPGTKIRLGFSDGMLSASAGCNTMSGDLRAHRRQARRRPDGDDGHGLPDNLMDQDQWLSTFLSSKPAAFSSTGTTSFSPRTSTEITFLDREQAEPDSAPGRHHVGL